MNPKNKWLRITGVVLHVLIGGLMLFAASGKVFGLTPAEEVQKLGPGIGDKLFLIGCGEMLSAILLLLPWTSPFGTLMTSGFWGGTICFHMSRGEDFTFQSILLAVTWLGAYLRGSVPLLASHKNPEADGTSGLATVDIRLS